MGAEKIRALYLLAMNRGSISVNVSLVNLVKLVSAVCYVYTGIFVDSSSSYRLDKRSREQIVNHPEKKENVISHEMKPI